jgi:hypothetical protein
MKRYALIAATKFEQKICNRQFKVNALGGQLRDRGGILPGVHRAFGQQEDDFAQPHWMFRQTD